MNGIHEVTGSIPVWSTNSNSLILNDCDREPTPFVRTGGALRASCGLR